MADELERRFGTRPRGAWLAERVWEPDLPTSLITAGYRWTVLDDAHFRAAAIPEEALWGPYTTDDQGKVLTVFGTEQGLRYRIPFSEVSDVIGYLRDHATEGGERVGTMGDDGEKFGGWPKTFDHCWGQSDWVERFFAALEANASWLTTVTPSGWLDGHESVGRVYLPTGSYSEMGEWALPADEALAFAHAVRDAKLEGRPETRWLRGAIWRNFQIKYREVNDLHKQMLRASDLVEAMPRGSARDTARDHLYAGQSNDPYWHGLFGGIYLPDLRVAALRHLIAAEDLALGGPGAPVESGLLVDLDLDGTEEVLLVGDGQIVAVKLDEGAGIGRWDIRAAGHPLAAVMRRRPEAYHEKLREHDRLASAPVDPDAGTQAPASIHDIVVSKQEGLSKLLNYDRYERRSGLVRLLPLTTTARDFDDGSARDLVDALDAEWSLESIGPDRVTASYSQRAGRASQDDPDRCGPVRSRPRRRGRDHQCLRRAPGRPARHRVCRHAPRGRPQSGRLPRDRRAADRPRRAAGGSRHRPPGVRQRAARRRAGDVNRRTGQRLDRPDRDRLELRGRLRTRVPGQRRPARSAHRPGARRTHLAQG